MGRYKVEFDRELCIGAFSCAAVAEKFWIDAGDGKVNLQDATFNPHTKKWELIIDSKDAPLLQESEAVCPVMAIKVTKID